MVEVAGQQGYGEVSEGVQGPAPVNLWPRGRQNGLRSTNVTSGGRVRNTTARLRRSLAASLDEEVRHGHLFHFVPVCLGGGAAIWFTVTSPPSVFTLGVVVFLLILTAGIGTRAGTVGSAGVRAGILVLVGMMLADWETRRVATVILDQPLVSTITGTVERREAGASGEWRYILRVTATSEPTIRRAPHRVSLLARSKHEPAEIGDQLVGRARLSPPSGPALPGLNDFAFQSYFGGIGAVGFFLGPPTAAASPDDVETTFLQRFDSALFSLRDRISTRIRTVLPGDPGAFAAQIITGERRSMSQEATEALRLSGLAHISAISGLNMALAAGIFFVGLRGLLSLLPGITQRFPIKKVAALGALVAITGYVFISGYQVSALRAYLMTAIMLVAVLFDRPAISLHNLSIAATLILAVQPSTVMGPSFQMSFAATAGLIAGYAGWRARPRAILPTVRSPGLRITAIATKFVAGTLATSLIGGLATAIFAITHFHRLSTHGLEANLAAMPLISIVVMPAGFLAMLLMPLGLDAPFFWIMGQGLELVLLVAHTVAGWGEPYIFPRLPSLFLIGTTTGILLLTLLRTALRHTGTVLILVTLMATWLTPKPPIGDLLISEDGRLVAFWAEDGEERSLAANRKRPPAFHFDQWRPVLGVESAIPPFMAPIAELPPAPDRRSGLMLSDQQRRAAEAVLDHLVQLADRNRFVCVRQACVARLSGDQLLITLERPDLVGMACDRANIVVLAARTRLTSCRSGAALFSETSLRSTGALEISDIGGAERAGTIKSSYSGPSRPWTSHRLHDWRSGKTGNIHPVEASLSVQRDSQRPGRDISGSGE
jgi:competence protein ComEC